MRKGRLILIPTPLGEGSEQPASAVINTLSHFIVETPRSARRALRGIGFTGDFDKTDMQTFADEAQAHDVTSLLAPIEEGHDIGLLTDAGCPGIADPGAEIVRMAHSKGIRVVPLAGSSSITLALTASGLNGQSFAFNGYLPINDKERKQALRELERRAATGQTQIFIEAPYRNNQLFKAIVGSCHEDTLLCVASELTLSDEFIRTRTVGEWKKDLPDLNKRPAVFLIGR